MNITIIHSNNIKDMSYEYIHMLLNKIKLNKKLNIQEFFIPKDFPQICNNCFACFSDPFSKCTHFKDSSYIMDTLNTSDLIILSCSYNDDSYNNMKHFLNHLSYRWMPHRENYPLMTDKIGLIIINAKIIYPLKVSKLMKNSLRLWGIKKIYNTINFHFERNHLKFNKKLTKLSNEILNL